MIKKVLFLALLCAIGTRSSATIRYVKVGFSGPQNGQSWATAYADLQGAINVSQAGDSLFVGQGDYMPAVYGSFNMKEGVKIYGGFLLNTSFSQRNPQLYVSRLLGNSAPVIINFNNNLTTSALLDGFTIQNGYAGFSGGGMLNRNVSPTINNCTFTSNVVFGAGGEGGGAIFNANGAPYISNCVFTNNSVNSNIGGGAIYSVSSSPTIINCTFTGNFASGTQTEFNNNGGAIFNSYASPSIINCTFTGNAAIGTGTIYTPGNGNGGAIYNNSSTGSIINCTITGNTSTGNSIGGGAGGGIYNASSTMNIVNCMISSNSSVQGGGGIYNINSDGNFTNCIIRNNTSNNGSGLYSAISTPSITNCTFSGNTATSTGGAIHIMYESPLIKNSVIWGNTSGVLAEGTTANISYSLAQNLSANAVTHNINGLLNPGFTDTATGDYQLQGTSPCINMGNNAVIPTGISTDYLGNTRIIGGVVDMGAFENLTGVPLPLHLTKFEAEELNSGIVSLRWVMSGADLAAHFDIQHSENGTDFTTIGNVTVAEKEINYRFEDPKPSLVNFYRLRVVNADGSDYYSTTVAIRMNTTTGTLAIYPNPAKESIIIESDNQVALPLTVLLTDISGKHVDQFYLEHPRQTLSLSKLAPGAYFLRLPNGAAFKIVKE